MIYRKGEPVDPAHFKGVHRLRITAARLDNRQRGAGTAPRFVHHPSDQEATPFVQGDVGREGRC